MITISKKLFCMIMLGLATVAVASVCSILALPMNQAVVAFVVTWIGMVAIFEMIDFENNDLPHGPAE